MAYIWFDMVLVALGKRINFESVSNIFGNSFVKDSSEIVASANPLVKQGTRIDKGLSSMLDKITIVNANDEQSTRSALEDIFGDMSILDVE